MSMLAEPRRKQKWSVDPRNSAWSNDDSKFGQKMLERMGWSKGKGLGRTEQGSTDHIAVKVKNNNHGLGANASHEDNWIAHQDEFNELLAQLNNHHGQNSSSEAQPEEKKGFSLEEKSKSSKKRVHYTKFTKGKDLSFRSKTDLNCIFGKRAGSNKDDEQMLSHNITMADTPQLINIGNGSDSSDSQGETEQDGTPPTSELDAESITKTVTSTMTMQEYFAQRMAQLKKARGGQRAAPSAEAEATETPGQTEDLAPVHSEYHDAEEPKKKKKKKKSKKPAEEMDMEEEKTIAPVVVEDKEKSSRKKKKKKTTEECGADESCGATHVLDVNCEQVPPPKKKKLKRQKESETLHGHDPAENESVESVVIPDKNRSQQEDGVVTGDKDELPDKKSKKKKKRRENKD